MNYSLYKILFTTIGAWDELDVDYQVGFMIINSDNLFIYVIKMASYSLLQTE